MGTTSVKISERIASTRVGIDIFDEDHRQLFEQAEALIDACEQGHHPLTQQSLLDDLIEYTLFHFEREENQMQEVDYPNFTEHKADHDLLLRAILKFKADLRYSRLEGEEVAEIILDWLTRHIRETDSAYTTYFHARGIH